MKLIFLFKNISVFNKQAIPIMQVISKKLTGLVSLKLGLSSFKLSSCNFNSKVPKEPHTYNFDNYDSKAIIQVDCDTIAHLERLSLVNFGNLKGVEILESSIRFAEKILSVNTSGVEPLTTVLENRVLHLRDDKVSEGNCRKSILGNAKCTEEEYFVAPPGNIPLEPQNQDILKERIKAAK